MHKGQCTGNEPWEITNKYPEGIKDTSNKWINKSNILKNERKSEKEKQKMNNQKY
jgi:hypothetical protein